MHDAFQNMDDIAAQKALLRKELKTRRAALAGQPAQQRQLALESKAICSAILRHCIYTQAPLILAYCAVSGEADIGAVIAQALADGKKAAIPRVHSNTQMDFYLLNADTTLASQTERGVFGIAEPYGSLVRLDADDIPHGTLILTPLAAADAHGGRLGHGRGCYDRYFARIPASVRICGCALAYQLCPHIPMQPHDRRLDFLACADGVHTCTQP